MEQHLKALFALIASWLAGVAVWLPTVDIMLRIALSIAGIVGIFYSSRYYKRHTPDQDDGQDSGI